MKTENLDIPAEVTAVNEEEIKIVPNNLVLMAGLYFGHKTQMWNPKMAKFIHSKRKGIHIIDVAKSIKALELTYKIINHSASKGAKFIFVGTKKHARAVVKEQALRSNSFYVAERWLGGTLTNNSTIFSRIKRLEHLEALKANNFATYTKKESVALEKELVKLEKNFDGIRLMKRQPNFMIVVDPVADKIAVTEARKKGVKIIGIVDTNGDPDLVDLAIPANDDSVKSIRLILTVLADAIVTAKGGTALLAYQNNENYNLANEKDASAATANRDADKTQEYKRENRNYRHQQRNYRQREVSENGTK